MYTNGSKVLKTGERKERTEKEIEIIYPLSLFDEGKCF